MTIRTHMGRSMDLSLWSNRLILGLTAAVLVAAVIAWQADGSATLLWAPLSTFAVWALGREIDPDHSWTALVAALAAGVWGLAGLEMASLLAVIALVVAARLVVNSTGRRPLTSDLVVIGLYATLISTSPDLWVAGFGLAVAIYVDDRMSAKPTTPGSVTALLAALGSSAVASLSSAFPQAIPEIRPLFVVAVGTIALIAVVREPTQPTSKVDSPLKNLVQRSRLHATRSLIGVLIFVTALLLGPDAIAVGPAAFALALALAATEVGRIRTG